MYNPKKDLIKSSYFIDESIFNNYNVNIVNLRKINKVYNDK